MKMFFLLALLSPCALVDGGFLQSSKISMADGTTALLQDVKAGDRLQSWDAEKGRSAVTTVTAVVASSRRSDQLVRITLPYASIRSTEDQVFWSRTDLRLRSVQPSQSSETVGFSVDALSKGHMLENTRSMAVPVRRTRWLEDSLIERIRLPYGRDLEDKNAMVMFVEVKTLILFPHPWFYVEGVRAFSKDNTLENEVGANNEVGAKTKLVKARLLSEEAAEAPAETEVGEDPAEGEGEGEEGEAEEEYALDESVDNQTILRKRKDFKGMALFIRFGLKFSGTRRRYGTYDDTEGGQCEYEDLDTISKSCRRHVATALPKDENIDGSSIQRPPTLYATKDCMGDASTAVCCHECMNCDTEECIVEVAGCQAFFEESLRGCYVPRNYDIGQYADMIGGAKQLESCIGLALAVALPLVSLWIFTVA